MLASPSISPRTRTILFIILGCALVLHVVSAVGVYAFRPESISTTPDPLDYRLAALNLLDHGTFSFAPPEYNAPQLLRTPVYPLLLAGTYLLDGRSGLAIVLLQSIMLAVMGWLLFWLLLAFRVPERISLALVALYLVEPLQWLYTLHTMTETTASLLMLGLFVFALVGRGIDTLPRAILFGVGLGLLVLVKPSVMMWLPFLLLLVLVARGTWRARTIRIALAALLLVATLTPWVIRNEALTGYPVVSSSGTYALIEFAGTASTTPAHFWDVVMMAEYNGHTNQVWYGYTTNAYPMLVAGKQAILEHLDYRRFVTRQLVCAPHVWFGFWHRYNQESLGHDYGLITSFVLGPNDARDAALLKIDILIWALALALFLLGTFSLLRDPTRRWRYVPLVGMLLAAIFVNFCAAWVRVLLPLYPIIFVGAGVGIGELMRLRRQHTQ
jgi:4-amino-4-deoxy-L-arabinose transferase-like glycosyltransferase